MSATTTGLSAREYGAVGLIGLLMGVALSRIGFTSWDEVHRMFSFQDLRLVFVFMFAVVVLVAGWTLIKKVSQPRWTSRLFHKGTIPGGILFGIGWAVSGAWKQRQAAERVDHRQRELVRDAPRREDN